MLRVVSKDGEQLGVMSREDALREAADRGLDLIEISDKSDPPVVKIVDFGKFKYEKEKTYKDNKKKQKVTSVKEIKIKPHIDSNDLNIKSKRAIDFLEKGKKVKVILFLRGRQRLYAEKGIAILDKLAEDFQEIATVEKMYSKSSVLLLTPKKK